MHGIDLIIIVLYLLGNVYIGFYTMKMVKSTADFVVAGRSMGSFVLICSLAAGAFGAFAALGQTGEVYTAGASALWISVAWSIGWIILIFISKKIYTTRAISLPDLFNKRFGETTSEVSGIISLIYIIATLAAQMAAMGTICSIVLKGIGVNYVIGAIIGWVIVILYSSLGGLFGVVYTEVFHFFVLLIGMGIMLPIICWHQGSIHTGGHILQYLKPSDLTVFGTLGALTIIGWILQYCFTAVTCPPYIQRALAAKDDKTAMRSQWGGMIWYTVLIFIVGGAVLAGKSALPHLKAAESFVPTMVTTYFPVGFAGFVMAAMLSVVMSTGSSYMLVAGTTFAHDVYRTFVKGIADQQILKVSKYATIVMGILALVLALWVQSVLKLFAYGTMVYGAGMFFPLMGTLFWKKITKEGVLAGIIGGGVVAILWSIFGPKNIIGVIPGSIVSGLCLWITTLVTYKDVSSKVTSEAV